MGRSLRIADGVIVDHLLNRANACRTLFEDDGDVGPMNRSSRKPVNRWKNDKGQIPAVGV
jgi:hypothetical protein